jgi:hypothetical protein
MKPTTYAQAEVLARERAETEGKDIPIHRLYKSGKFTLDKPAAFDHKGQAIQFSVHNTIAAPTKGEN